VFGEEIKKSCKKCVIHAYLEPWGRIHKAPYKYYFNETFHAYEKRFSLA